MKTFLSGLVVAIGIFWGMNAEALDYAKWAGYDYPAPGAVLSMAEGDVDGDGKNEIVAVSFEGDEKISAPAMAPRLAAPGSVTVTPDIFYPANGTKITFGNLPSQAIIVIYNEFENKVREIWTGNTTTEWNVRNNNGDICPSGTYKYIVINRQSPDQKAEGFFTIKNVQDKKGGLIVRILKVGQDNSHQLLDELKVRVDGIPIINLVVKDVDKDGRDEITFSAMYDTKTPMGVSTSYVNWESIWTGRVYVYGYDGSKLIQKYQSPNLLGKEEIMLGLEVADSDGDGKNEIIAGITSLNRKNADNTGDNFELLGDYIDQHKYLAAANLMHSGLIKGPLLESSITKIKCNGSSFDAPTSYPSGPGLLYNITTGNLDTDAGDEVVANVTDLNYKNVNKFIEDLAWEIARADKETKLTAPSLQADASSSDSESKSMIKSLSPAISQVLETEEFGLLFPDAQIAKIAVSLLGQSLVGNEKKPAQAPQKLAAAPSDYWDTGHPWYDNEASQELISRTEETLIPEGTKFPEIPDSLLEGQLRLLNWNGSGYEIKESSQRVGFFSQNTVITKNKEIVVKAVESKPIHAENLLNSIMSNLVRVEEVTRDRWVNPYSGEKWTHHDESFDIKHIPQLTGDFLVSKVYKFDANLNRLWSSPSFGAFNLDMKLKDLDGNGDEEIITASGKLDYTKVNTILSHLDNQFQLSKQYENAGKGDDFEVSPPTLPSDILAAKIQVYGSSGTELWNSNVIGMFISGIDVLGNINGKEEIAVGINEMANINVINNYIAKWQNAVQDVLPKRQSWRAGSFTTFMNELLPNIEQYNNWAVQWCKNERQWGYGNNGYYGPINPQRPDISYPSYSQQPDVIEPAEPSDDEINSIIASKVQVYKWGTSSMSLSWQSPSFGHLLTDLITTNVDGTATPYLAGKEIVAAGIDLSPLFDEEEPKTTIHVFRSPISSGIGTVTVKILNLIGEPLSGALVEVGKGIQILEILGTGTTSAEGIYSITEDFSFESTYTIKASCGQYLATRSVTLWPLQNNYHVLKLDYINYSQWVNINGTTTAAIPVKGTVTIACNTYGTGTRVNLYIYHDEGTIGFLDAEDHLLDILGIQDNSHIDESNQSKEIQWSQFLLNDAQFIGNFIVQAIDLTTGISAYARVTATQTDSSLSISGKVIVDGIPAKNAVVFVKGGNSDSPEQAVFTDTNGAYTISVISGVYRIKASKKIDYMCDSEKMIYVGTNSVSNLDFSLNTAEFQSISGRVTTQDEQPIAGAKVWVENHESNNEENTTVVTTVTNNNGSYTLYLIKSNQSQDYNYIKAGKSGYEMSQRYVSNLSASNIDFTLNRSQEMIIGTITDNNGSPILGARVRQQNLIPIHTNCYGHYLLLTNNGYGFSIEAQKKGYAKSGKNNINSGATNVNISLYPYTATITGKIYAPDGTTTMGFVKVSTDFWVGNSYNNVYSYTNPDGSYELHVLGGSNYGIYASKEGYNSAGNSTNVPNTGVNMILQKGYYPSVSGTISYAGTKTGMIYIQLFNSQDFSGQPAYQKVINRIGDYMVSNIYYGTFSAMAFLDINGDGQKTSGEPAGIYPDPIISSYNVSVTNANIVLTDPGTIIGTISYSGTKTGTAFVRYSTDPSFDNDPKAEATLTITGAGSYSFTSSLPVGTYYIACWFDAESPYESDGPSGGDVLGIHGGTITMFEGEVEVTGTPTPVIVKTGSVTAGVSFNLNYVVPSLPRIPMPTATINVDGIDTGWTGIQPAGTDTTGDNIAPGTGTILPGSDLKAMYIAQDGKNLCLRLDIYGTANTMFQNYNSDPNKAGRYQFHIHTNADVYNNIEVSVVYSEKDNRWAIQAWDRNNQQNISALQQQGTVAVQGGIIELALPLDVLHYPAELTIRTEASYWLNGKGGTTLDRIGGVIAYQPLFAMVDLKINGTTSATVTAGGAFTLTCNSSSGRRVDFHLFHDQGVSGALEPTYHGVPCDIFEIDNSNSDENKTAGQIQRTVMAFGGSPVVAGKFILQAVDVTSGAVSQASIDFTPQTFGQSISGVVTLDGSPATNLIVQARSGSEVPEFVAITDTNGQYILRLPAGSWILKVYKIGYPSSDIQEVYVSAGGSVTGINLSLNTTGLSTIVGQVMTGNKPLAGVMVRAANEDKNREVWMVTGTGGTYTLYVTPNEIWTVMAEKNGYNSHPQAMSVHILPASNINFMLMPNTVPIIGTVTGSGPVIGAKIEGWRDGYSRVVAQTNSQGQYSLYVSGGSNMWNINASAHGSAETAKNAYPGDMMINMNLQWHNGTISGNVYAPDGTGLGFAEVEASGRFESSINGFSMASDIVKGLTNPDGTYQLPVVNGLRYEVTAKKPNYGSPAPQSILIGSGTTLSTATVNLVMLGADLWIDKWAGRASYEAEQGTNLIYPGATMTYHIMYGNRGEGTVGSVTITDTLPLGVILATATANFPLTISSSGSQTVLTYRIGTLKPNEEGHFKIVVSIPADMPASTTLTNVTNITTPEYEKNMINNYATWTTHVFKMDLSISKWGPKKILAGGTFTYTITLNNIGNIDAPAVVITDTLPTGVIYGTDTLGGASVTTTGTGTIIVWEIGTFTANRPKSFELSVIVGTNTTGTLTNTVNITTTEKEFTLLNNSSTWKTLVEAPIRDLMIKKQGLSVVKAGTRMRYQISYANLGNVAVKDIVITDNLPAGVSYVKDTSGFGTETVGTNAISWAVGSLEPNERGYFELVVDVNATGTLVNVAQISGTGTEAKQATWTTNAVSGTVDLVIDKKCPTQVFRGGTILYAISYDNHGNTEVGSATIRDTLPAGFEYATCTLGSPTTMATTSVATVLEWVVGTITPWSYNYFNLTVKVNALSGKYDNVVEIRAIEDPNLTNNLSTATTQVSTPVYDLIVRKGGPSEATPGQRINYWISYGNQGNIQADRGTITDTLPLGVTYISSSPSGSVTGAGVEGNPFVVTWSGANNGGYINLIVEVGTNTPSATLTNVVKIEGTRTSGGVDPLWNNQATVTTKIKTPIVDLRIRKSGPKQAKPGQIITYTISYANSGNTPATATITDVLPAGVSYISDTSRLGTTTDGNKISWEVGTVTSGTSSGIIQGFELTVLVGTNTTGTLTNAVSISTSIDDNPANNQDTAITYIVTPVVDLSITKSAPGEVAPGQMMVYYITYRNKGNTDAGSVTITDELPVGVTYGTSTIGTPTIDGNKLLWCLGTVSPSLWPKSFKITVAVGNLPCGTLTNVVKINDAVAIDNNLNDNQSTTTTQVVVPVSDLSIHKAGPAEITPNSVIIYYIGYKNKGNIAVGSVTITDTLPVGVSYRSDNSGLSTSIVGGQIVWQIGTLTPGAEGRFSVKAFVGEIQGSSTLTNSVEIYSPSIQDEDTSNNVASLSSHVVLPATDLLINKFGPKSVVPNQEITYRISYANLGNSEATNVEIIDTLPAGVSYKGDTSGISPLLLVDTVIWQIPSIPANTSKSFELTVFVGDVPASTTLTNQAKITILANDTNSANNDANWQTLVQNRKEADVMVIKQGSGARPGWDKTYHITYRNIGTDRAEEVVVIDYLPAEVTYLSSNPVGNYDSTNHSLTWDIGNLNACEDGDITVYVNVDGNKVSPGDKIKNTVKISTVSFEKRYGNNVFVEEETARGSIDPNDKLASPNPNSSSDPIPGEGFLSDVRDTREISYKIRFENIAGSYTLAAREVRIIDKLDANMDWDTLEMGNVGIGTRTYSLGTWSYGTTYGTVSYSFDKTTGSLTWYFIGDDSSLPPIESGFLPQNVTKPEGEGCVNYSIKAKGTATSGTIIRNKANIRFDWNPWIETPEVYHILDLTPPSATITTLPYSTSTTFLVSWSGQDTAGATTGAISEYTVYLSIDGGTATEYMSGTATSAYYSGQYGKTYAFYAIAKDKAGNVGIQSAPAQIKLLAPGDIEIKRVGPKAMGIGGTVTLYATVLGTETLTTATWTITSGVGSLSTNYGTATIFTALQIGTVSIKADDGTNTDTIMLIVGDKINAGYTKTTPFSFGSVTLRAGTSAVDIYILPPQAMIPVNLSGKIGDIGVEINAYGTSGDKVGSVTLYVEIGYNEALLGNMDEETLKLWISSDGSKWEEVNPSDSDPVRNIVYGTITHLSYLAPAGKLKFADNLKQVIVYPNPYLQDKHGYSIFFDRLTENSTIKIFNIAGELVQEIAVQSSPQSWNACNFDGEKVASGIYIYLITDPMENKKTGKLAIIR
ncbi:MAG: carboxypeptidase regulatory-like domain-containing protein [Candidatus Desantisbacteria bacterium]